MNAEVKEVLDIVRANSVYYIELRRLQIKYLKEIKK